MIYNGTYTLQNAETGEHRTFNISTQKFAPGKRILSLLSGTDNTSDYTGFAFIEDDKITVWHSKRGQQGKKSPFEYYAALIEQLVVTQDENEEIKTSIEFGCRSYIVMISKRCMVCNRKLTSPESIKLGVGPVCAGR